MFLQDEKSIFQVTIYMRLGNICIVIFTICIELSAIQLKTRTIFYFEIETSLFMIFGGMVLYDIYV